MLRRMKIGGRVNLLIAVPLLALIAVTALGYVALERSSVRSDDYRDLRSAQDLRADTLPPPATLLQAWAEVNAIGLAVASSEGGFESAVRDAIAGHLRVVERARADFDSSMDAWALQPLDPSVRADFVVDGREAGDAFFVLVDEQLVPAVETEDSAGVLAAIAAMQPLYATQQIAASSALAWADTQVAEGERRNDDFVAQVLLFGGAAIALIALLTLLLAVRVRRSIVRPIRSMASQASGVAGRDLAAAVAATEGLPADAPVPHLAPFQVSTRDELAELAGSFTSVQDTAVELAAAQSRTRQIVSQNIVNIARRNQSLLGRTLGFISTLEQNEHDPEMLDNLFRIDHLATRMRRNAQSLLVLAGAEPARLWSPPIALGEVVRAALSEVEHYGQIELGDVGSAHVQGAVAHEVSHLLAELLENATNFSPPTTIVTVVGRAVPDGHQLAVFDHGLGMSDAELMAANERLNAVSSLDRDSSPMLGFQVVATLARRHGIQVMLTTTPGGTGVTAVIRLPKSILEVPAPQAEPLGDDDPVVEPHRASPADVSAAAETELVTARLPVTADEPGAELGPEGLPKRVRGAQLLDGGVTHLDAPPARGADEVRDALSSLQRGVDLARRQAED